MLRTIVGRLHVGESNRAVCRMIWKGLRPVSQRDCSRGARERRKKAYRVGIKIHNENREAYRQVMRGW